MVGMRILLRAGLGVVIALSCVLAIYLLWAGPKQKETLAALTGALAVTAAGVAALPALRVLELQEDSLKPHPIPYFDVESRYQLVQLRVKNVGASPAYDLHFDWDKQIRDYEGNNIQSLDDIGILLPQQSASTLVGTSTDTVKRLRDTKFTGVCTYKDAAGKKHSHRFSFSVDGHLKQLIHNEEMPKTLRKLQDLPDEVERLGRKVDRLCDILQRLVEVKGNESESR